MIDAVAWREGYRANDRGQWTQACPYNLHDARRDSWIAGWQSCERDRQPAKE